MIARVCTLRLNFCKHLKTWRTYGKGWTSRIAHIEASGQAVAMGSVGPQPAYFIGGESKALLEDAIPAPPKSLGDATGVGGVATSTVAQVQAALTPAATVEWIGHILTAITVIGGIAAAAGFAYSAWARQRESERSAALMLMPEQRSADPIPANDNEPIVEAPVAPEPALTAAVTQLPASAA